MNLEQYIPFVNKQFRPHQKEAIIKIIEAIEAGHKNIVLNACVGLGKSLIAYVLSQYFLEKKQYKTYIYTSTKFLQDQYTKDFKNIQTGKGRTNFNCIMHAGKNTCEEGRCKKEIGFKCPYGITIDKNSMNPEDKLQLKDTDTPCPYWEQKVKAIQEPVTLLNYTYALTDKKYVHHFPNRDITIYDEGHNIEKEIMSFLELKLSQQQLKKDINYKLNYTEDIYTWIDELENIAKRYEQEAKKYKK